VRATEVTGTLVADVSNDVAVGRGALDPAASPVPSDVVPALASGSFGLDEGTPSTWVAVRVATDVAVARATFADGVIDEMQPVEGWAVLLRQGGDGSGAVEAMG